MFLNPITFGYRTGAQHDPLQDRYSFNVYRERTKGQVSVDADNYLFKSTYFWIAPYMINKHATPVNFTFTDRRPETTNALGSVKSSQIGPVLQPQQQQQHHHQQQQPTQGQGPAQALFDGIGTSDNAMGSIRIVGRKAPVVVFRDVIDFRVDDPGTMSMADYMQLKQSLERLNSLIRDTDNVVDTAAEEERMRATLYRFARESSVARNEREWIRVLNANYPEAMARLNMYGTGGVLNGDDMQVEVDNAIDEYDA
ncbi:Orf99 [Heliothis zea nudivirus]|uniref:Orf99 n=1 Tax=Heliothis zea nudivirus 1 TaxID=3116536 RepID=Q8JKL4_9VIRU|nr:Orf99 [Heliothis zea nudivirus]AAN04393.1 Orf99 [Heliothis zea nudivirus]